MSATPLIYAIRSGHTDIVKLLLDHPDINVNCIDDKGFTPLHIAVEKGFTEVARMLTIHPTIKVNYVSKKVGTPLFFAAYRNHTEIVDVLLMHEEIDVNHVSKITGNTALCCAAMKGHMAVIKLLLNHHDIDPDIRNKKNKTAVEMCKTDEIRQAMEAAIEASKQPLSSSYDHCQTLLERMSGILHELESGGADENYEDTTTTAEQGEAE